MGLGCHFNILIVGVRVGLCLGLLGFVGWSLVGGSCWRELLERLVGGSFCRRELLILLASCLNFQCGWVGEASFGSRGTRALDFQTAIFATAIFATAIFATAIFATASFGDCNDISVGGDRSVNLAFIFWHSVSEGCA